MKKFYTHIIEIESLIIELDKMELDHHEKLHLAKLIDANLHHTILDTILSELSEHDKEVFLKHLSESNNEKIWEHLNSRIDGIEEKIKKAAEDLKKEIYRDIKDSRKAIRSR